MGGTILSEADGIVSGNPNDLMSTQCRQADGTSGIRDEVLGPYRAQCTLIRTL